MVDNLDISTLVTDHNSEESFSDTYLNLLACSSGIIHVRTSEIIRALTTLRVVSVTADFKYNEWDVNRGLREYAIESLNNRDVQAKDEDGRVGLADVLGRIEIMCKQLAEAQEEGKEEYHIFTFVNPLNQLESPVVMDYFINFCDRLPLVNISIVIITHDTPLPPQLLPYAVSVDFTLPGHGELVAEIQNVVSGTSDSVIDLSEEDMARIAVIGSGMTRYEFSFAISRSVSDKINEFDSEGKIVVDAVAEASDIVNGVQRAKTEVVRKNDLLEMIEVEDIENIGGMDILKEWVGLRANCYSEEFKQFGGEAPKGIVLVGIPGTGKSFVAKAVGGVLGIPVVKLDFSKVFNSLVGASEERMRTSLNMIEAMAPVVVLADEIDKGLGGIGGSGDSGTSMRVLGTFLTWLQENKTSVFTILTANNITGLPPELTRKGRLDEIFTTSLPNEWEREDVLRIHLRIRGHDLDVFEEDEIAEFRKVTNGYSPAEIEGAVKSALVYAFNENTDDPVLMMEHVIKAVKAMVPMSESHKEHMLEMARQSAQIGVPASLTVDEMGAKRGKTRTVAKRSGNVSNLRNISRRSRKPSSKDKK